MRLRGAARRVAQAAIDTTARVTAGNLVKDGPVEPAALHAGAILAAAAADHRTPNATRLAFCGKAGRKISPAWLSRIGEETLVHGSMMRRYLVFVLIVGFSLTACGGASTSGGAFAPRASVASVQPLIHVLHNFTGSPDGEMPWGGLLAGKDGEYYGTSVDGGDSRQGTVYEITASGKETVIYSFAGAPDGASPRSTLIMDKEGSLYGTTYAGGRYSCDFATGGCGTVFKLTPGKQRWTESVLYSFQGGNDDGAEPESGLLMTKHGALLGTTAGGGLAGRRSYGGVIFELTRSGSSYKEKIVHRFTGPPDGLVPLDALVSDSSGNLYGTTLGGGRVKLHCPKRDYGGCGTVFRLTPSGSTYNYSVIYRFKGVPRDGSHPSASLLLRSNGVFYGLTTEGGSVGSTGQGTVFSITTSGSEHMIYRFLGGNDGSDPDDTPGLIADRSGNLYGTTAYGGSDVRAPITCSGGCGTVFKLAPSNSGFTHSVLFAFQYGADGALPYGGLPTPPKREASTSDRFREVPSGASPRTTAATARRLAR